MATPDACLCLAAERLRQVVALLDDAATVGDGGLAVRLAELAILADGLRARVADLAECGAEPEPVIA